MMFHWQTRHHKIQLCQTIATIDVIDGEALKWRVNNILWRSEERNIEGRRSRGRPRTTWLTDLTKSTGAKYLYY